MSKDSFEMTSINMKVRCFHSLFSVIRSVERNAQKQAELAKERDELNRTIQENKLLDEQEKTRWELKLSPLADFFPLSLSDVLCSSYYRKNSVKKSNAHNGPQSTVF